MTRARSATSRAMRAGSAARIAALGLLLLCAAGSGAAQDASDELVARFVARMRQGDLEAARALFAAEALPKIEDKALLLLHHALERLEDPELAFVHRATEEPDGAGRREARAYQLRDASSSILLILKIRTRDAEPGIDHVEWQPAPLDLRERFPFALGGVPPLLHLVLAAAIAIPLLTLYALLLCWRRRPRAWGLWMLFILLGVGKLSVLWLPSPFHSSYVRVTPFSIQPFGAGFAKVPSYDPWTLSVSLPLGALLFLACRRRVDAKRSGPAAR